MSLLRSQFSLTLQPAWRLQSTNDKVRCTNGDPWELMLDQVNSQIIDWAQWGINELIKTFNSIPAVPDIQEVCWNTPAEPNRCGQDPKMKEHFRECQDAEAKGGLDMTCYFHRVHTICSNTNMLLGYSGLFMDGYQDADNLQAQYEKEFGDSYDMLDPQMLQLMEETQRSTLESGPDLSQRREICSSDAFYSAMRLDQIIVSCMFAIVEQACPPDYEDDESFAFTIESTTFKLPLVRWTYGNPPQVF